LVVTLNYSMNTDIFGVRLSIRMIFLDVFTSARMKTRQFLIMIVKVTGLQYAALKRSDYHIKHLVVQNEIRYHWRYTRALP